MSTSVQPLALVRNNELIYIEENKQRRFSCFKIIKLKGPIDVNYLLSVIFPSSEKRHYDLEVSEYNGRSAKVKFNFTNRTHKDLIRHLQNATEKFYDISENGLVDWLASDTVTFKTIYQNTDMTAFQQLSDTNNTSNSYDTFTTSSTSTPSDTQLYPIVDEKVIEQELEELSKRISSQMDHDLERLFHNTFQRRDMTITIPYLAHDFFGQIENLVVFTNGDDDDPFDENMLSPEKISLRFARYLYKHAERYIDSSISNGFVRGYKFGIMLTLWNLANVFHSIRVSYKVLLETDEKFKQIFQSQKAGFMGFLSNMDKTLMDLLIILCDDIDREKYERLQRRLTNFIKATENLKNLVTIINNKCNEQLEKLEDQKKGLTSNLLVATTTLGVSALAFGGYLYNLYNNSEESKDNSGYDDDTASQTKSQSGNSTSIKEKRSNERKSTEGIHKKLIGGALMGVAGAAGMTMMNGYSTRKALQNSINQHSNVLDQLKLIHSKLLAWNNLSEIYIERDINDVNNSRIVLHDEFVKIRFQCKCLGEIFDMLELE